MRGMNISKLMRTMLLGTAIIVPISYGYLTGTKQREAWVWGFGRNGQLGLGSQNNFTLPQMIKNIKLVDVDAKKSISAGITVDGKLYTWGKNRNGILGHQPANLNVLIPREVEIDEKIMKVSCGHQHLCVLTEKGNLYVWGIDPPKNNFRTIGTVEKQKNINHIKPYKIQLPNIKQISCSGEYISLVNENGEVFLMGQSKIKGVNGIEGKKPTDIIQLAIGGIERIQSGLNFSIALNKEGKVLVWGGNTFGQLGIGGLKNVYQPQYLELKEKIVDISCGENYTGVITENGEVYTWGFGNEGQLGHGDKSDQFLPRKIINLKGQKAKQISCGGAHTALLMESGKLFLVGRGRQGQLGRQQKDQSNSGYSLQFKQVQQLPKDKIINKVVCGANHTIVLLEQPK